MNAKFRRQVRRFAEGVETILAWPTLIEVWSLCLVEGGGGESLVDRVGIEWDRIFNLCGLLAALITCLARVIRS